VTETSVQDKIM